MLNNESLFIRTKDEIEKLWSNNKKLSNFVKWPKNLVLKEKTTHKINVTEKPVSYTHLTLPTKRIV